MENVNTTKAATFQKFSSNEISKHTVNFFVTLVFSIFMRQTLTDYFVGLHKKYE